MTPQTTPLRLNLKKDEKLEVEWADGVRSVYTVSYLRALCPCAMCKVVREGNSTNPGESHEPPEPAQPAEPKKKTLLPILPGNYSKPLQVMGAELVGNYALRIDWSDEHGSGIYSFQYLRDIAPKQNPS